MPAVMMGSSFSGVQGWYGRQQTRELDWRCQAPLVQLMIQLLSGGTILVEAEAGDSIETLKGIIRSLPEKYGGTPYGTREERHESMMNFSDLCPCCRSATEG